MFNKVVVANRGAVAARVLRALNAMGIKSAAVYSEADYGAPYLEMASEAYAIGAAPARDSYLNQDVLLDVLKRAGADGVHPGYGFLAENAGFAQRVEDAGARFIGPSRQWIANELLIKLGTRVSPCTVGKYMPKRPPGQPRGDQRWATFLRNHARVILACDFFVAVTATFRLLYVFVVIEHGRRQLPHVGVTNHPTADWTLQQLREVVGDEGTHRSLIHDRDSIFARHLDNSIRALGLKVLRTPF